VPVIATALLLIVAMSAALVVYAYVSGATVVPDTDQHVGKMLEKLKTVEVKGSPNGDFKVSIMNVGTNDAVIDMFYVKDFDGNTIAVVPVTVPIGVGETETFLFDSWVLGNGPWSWYEIYGVTQRGNTVRANLFSFLSAAYELGDRPSGNEQDYLCGVENVTIDNIPTPPANLPNLTAIDNNYFGFPATNWNYTGVSFPTSVFEFDMDDGIYHSKGDVSYLADLTGEPYVLLYNTKVDDTTSFTSGNFSGNTGNYKYPKIIITFIFYVQPSRWAELSGTVQFFDWSANEYATSGDGYATFDGDTLPYGIPPAQSGFKNFTMEIDKGAWVDSDGKWNVLVNITTNNPTTVKLDYFTVQEKVDYIHGFETVFWYSVSSDIDENNVTDILLTTTGSFPSSIAGYWYQVFNFDTGVWDDLGTFQGTSSDQTIFYDINGDCGKYIDDSTKVIKARIMPMEDLPDAEMLNIDQTRAIIRQVVS